MLNRWKVKQICQLVDNGSDGMWMWWKQRRSSAKLNGKFGCKITPDISLPSRWLLQGNLSAMQTIVCLMLAMLVTIIHRWTSQATDFKARSLYKVGMLNKHWLVNDLLSNWWSIIVLNKNRYIVNNSTLLDMQQWRSVVYDAYVTEAAASVTWHLICASVFIARQHTDSASYPQRDGKWVVAMATGWRPSVADWGDGVPASCTVGPTVR